LQINIDFNLLFPDRNLKLYDGWNHFVNEVLNIKKTTDTNIQDFFNN